MLVVPRHKYAKEKTNQPVPGAVRTSSYSSSRSYIKPRASSLQGTYVHAQRYICAYCAHDIFQIDDFVDYERTGIINNDFGVEAIYSKIRIRVYVICYIPVRITLGWVSRVIYQACTPIICSVGTVTPV